MALISQLYLLTSGVLVLGGLTVVGLSTRAYMETTRRAMIHLSLGFTLVVAATLSTAISGYLTGFTSARTLLFVNTTFNAAGYLFVVYSLLTYE